MEVGGGGHGGYKGGQEAPLPGGGSSRASISSEAVDLQLVLTHDPDLERKKTNTSE